MTEENTSLSLSDRFLGCMLGLAVGDALGAPLEGLPADVIYHEFGLAHKIIAKPPVECLTYTDDTQMMIGIAQTLLEHGEIHGDKLMAAFVRNFEPERGYGEGTRRIMDVAATGGDWRASSHSQFPGGSKGNGAAMRVAPVGLLFHDDLDIAAEQAIRSAIVTHVHPTGIDSAQLMAIAVALAMQPGPFNRERFFSLLIERVKTEDFHYPLIHASRLTVDDFIGTLGNTVEADRSVPTAIACFALHPDSYTDAVGRAIGLGGDVDTLAAMAGALSGARLGVGAIPRHLLAMLEQGPQGRDYIAKLATDLVQLHESRRSSPQ